MKILVVGSGGREHALAWRLAQSPGLQKVFVAPGNAGTAREQELENLPLTDIHALADYAQRERVHATVVGPEAPLAAGIVDVFRARNLRIFGPTKAAAQLESSKDFAKRFMTRHKIPTAKFQTFADIKAAHAYIDAEGAPIVIKADGLAAGKGVVVAMDVAEAHAAVDMMLADNKLGDAGARVVIEEFLDGEEASFIVMADGRHALALATSQDHKRLKDGDQGTEHRRYGCLLAGTGGDAGDPRPRHARGDHADHQRHGRRRHRLHRLPLCRPDDQARWQPARTRIQLPHG
jgi:phosphoribosylamine--glycine ligase